MEGEIPDPWREKKELKATGMRPLSVQKGNNVTMTTYDNRNCLFVFQSFPIYYKLFKGRNGVLLVIVTPTAWKTSYRRGLVNAL